MTRSSVTARTGAVCLSMVRMNDVDEVIDTAVGNQADACCEMVLLRRGHGPYV
jgi:hypothetical protein